MLLGMLGMLQVVIVGRWFTCSASMPLSADRLLEGPHSEGGLQRPLQTCIIKRLVHSYSCNAAAACLAHTRITQGRLDQAIETVDKNKLHCGLDFMQCRNTPAGRVR